MSELKYKLKKTSFLSSYYVLVALRDIPEYGVKAGDLGGIVDKTVSLSHEGSCWIGKDAKVLGNVYISNDAYVGDNAIVVSRDNARIIIRDNARVFDDAKVLLEIVFRSDANRVSRICGNAQVFGSASLRNTSEVSGDAKVFGAAKLGSWVSVTGESEVSGNVELETNSSITGNSKLTDNVKVAARAIIHNSQISGSIIVGLDETIVDGKKKNSILPSEALISPANTDKIIETTLTKENLAKVLESYPDEVKKAFFGNPDVKPKGKQDKVNDTVQAFNEVVENISSYETDIVKIIKYPVMTDRTDPYTRAMVSAVNRAKRHLDNPDSDAFKDAVLNLEDAFLAAESNARKLASTLFSDAEKRQAENAKNLLAIAANEASSEQEKKMAFKQGFKQLEGIIDVPEIAVDTFRVKIGLKELEA